MELKLRPALMSLLALSGAAATANAATAVQDLGETVTPVDSAEWATNSSAPVDTESNSRRSIDPSQAPARAGDPTAKRQPAARPDDTYASQDVPYHWLDTTRRVVVNCLGV